MAVQETIELRLKILVRVVDKECKHLTTMGLRLFCELFSLEQASRLEADPALVERVDAFVGRFGRRQDTVSVKQA